VQTFLCLVLLSLSVVISAGEDLWFVLSSNDQAIAYQNNGIEVIENPGPGSLSHIAMTEDGIRVRHLENVPASIIGPPKSLAVRKQGGYALVTNATLTKETEEGHERPPDSTVRLVKLSGGSLQVVDTVEVGTQPSGVSFFPTGGRAMVANRADGTLSLIALENGEIRELSRSEIALPSDSLSDVVIAPNENYALASLQKGGAVLLISLEEGMAPRAIQRIETGSSPYALAIHPDGTMAAVADVADHNVTLLSIENGKAAIIQRFSAGRIAEGIDFSPCGEWLAVSSFDGVNLTDDAHPLYGTSGGVYLFRREGKGFTPSHSLSVSGGPQMVLFTPNSDGLIVANTGAGQLLHYKLVSDRFELADRPLEVPGEPIALARPGS